MKIIHQSIVLQRGWEMDNSVWVVEDKNGSRTVKTTCHERPVTYDELDDKIAETKASLDGLLKAKELTAITDRLESIQNITNGIQYLYDEGEEPLKVRVNGCVVGEIRKVETGFQYYSEEGETDDRVFATLMHAQLYLIRLL